MVGWMRQPMNPSLNTMHRLRSICSLNPTGNSAALIENLPHDADVSRRVNSGVRRLPLGSGNMKCTEALEVVVKSRKKLAVSLLFILFLSASSCTSGQKDNRTSPEQPSSGLNSQANKSPESASTAPSRSQSNSIFAEIDNQMSVVELRERLNEVKTIESEARRMVILRRNWAVGVPECMEIMKRLKPRANAIRDEYKRMLSPAGIYIASAAMNLVGCINCVENDEDDCSYARDFINKAERELKKEERRK